MAEALALDRFAWVRVQLAKTHGRIQSLQDVSHPTLAVRTAWPVFDGVDREMVVVLSVDTHGRANAADVVSIGTLDEVTVHPREVFTTAILRKAAEVIVLHNHPTGNVTPSASDLALVRRLAQAGEILGIHLRDFIVVGDTPDIYTSLRERGFLLHSGRAS